MAAPLSEILWKGKNKCRIEKLKVKQGSHVSVGSLLVICTILKENNDGEGSENPQIERLKSSLVGTVDCLYVKTGQTVDPGGLVMTVAPCNHPTVMKDMCADCGADLRVSQGKPGERIQHAAASVAMVHNIPELHVSREVAYELAQLDVQSLLRNRKLVLIVDLDQTVIHTTMRNVKTNLPGVHHFQLMGLPWYHTKIRPGCKKFLEKLSESFQLHIFTMGSRPYAHTVARILDPDKKLFADRILSRDECFDPNSKTANLSSIFPTGDHMVCIIDDREDVWNFAPNLIHVKPYQYFGDTEDINIPPGLFPKTGNQLSSITDETKIGQTVGETQEKGSDKMDIGEAEVKPDVVQKLVKPQGTEVPFEAKEVSGTLPEYEKNQLGKKIEPCKQKDGDSAADVQLHEDDIRADSTTEEEGDLVKEVAITKNINNNEAVNKDCKEGKENKAEDVASERAIGTSEVSSSTTGEEDTGSASVDSRMEKDSDAGKEEKDLESKQSGEGTADKVESIQEGPSKGTQGDTVTEDAREPEKDGESRQQDVKVTGKEEGKGEKHAEEEITSSKTVGDEEDCSDDYLLYLEEILLKIHTKFFTVHDHFIMKKKDFVPDVKVIVPSLRKKVLAGVRITFSGVFPRNLPPERYRLWNVAISLGASVSKEFVPKSKEDDNSMWTTHVIAAKPGTSKVHMAKKNYKVQVVTPQWLLACWERWEQVDERLFQLPKSPTSQSASGSGRSTPASESEPSAVPKMSAGGKKQVTIPERTKPSKNQAGNNNNNGNNSDQLPLTFCEDYNPLYSISAQEIKAMDKEVEDIFGESSSSSDNSDSEDMEEELSIDSPSGQSLGSITQELPSSSDESLTAESPRGWKRKREDGSGSSESEEGGKEGCDEDSNSPPSDDNWTTDEERDEMADAIDDLLTYSTTARSFSTHMPK